MKKLVESSDKENMRMAMLKHEETFRQQVYELHRLYRIQKMLMKNIEQNKGRRGLDLEQPAEEITIDESEIELTLGPSSYNQRPKRAETKQTADSGPCFSSSSTGSSQGNKLFARNYREISERFRGGSQMGFIGSVDVEEEMRLRQHPWLYQVVP